MDVDDAAAELYGRPLDEFVSTRDALVKQAKSEGAKGVAARVKALRKPTLPAWLVNQLAREHGDALGELASVGDSMREATEQLDGARLRELTAGRRDLVDTLVDRVRDLAERAGQRAGQEVLDAVSETLLAATADPGVAAEVRAGRLTRPLRHVGFGPVGGTAPIASSQVPKQTREEPRHDEEPAADADEEADVEEGGEAEPDQESAPERDDAEHELRQAESDVAAAEERVRDLEDRLDERRDALESAESEVERLIAELEAARAEHHTAREAVEHTETELSEARAAAEDARKHRREVRRGLA